MSTPVVLALWVISGFAVIGLMIWWRRGKDRHQPSDWAHMGMAFVFGPIALCAMLMALFAMVLNGEFDSTSEQDDAVPEFSDPDR